MPICLTCRDWYSVKSRIAGMCRKCKSEQIAEAAKEIDSKSLSIASISSWAVFQRRPKKYKAAWGA